MRKNYVLFMGQLREPSNFLKCLDDLQFFIKNRIVSKILFVTDTGYVTNDFKIELIKNNVELLEKEPLDDKYLMKFDPMLKKRKPGIRKESGGMRAATIWRQLYDLNYALKHIPDEANVLRTRTDIYIDKQFLEKLFLDDEFRKVDPLKYPEFKEKIWIQWFSLSFPFYIHDTAFYGCKGDISKLVNNEVNIELAKYYPTSSLPIFFWILPFYKKNKIFKLWLEQYAAQPFKTKLLNDPLYLKILYEYYKVIDANFKVYFPEVKWSLQWNPGKYVTRCWHVINEDESLSKMLSKCNRRTRHNAAESNKTINEIINGKRDTDPLVYRMKNNGQYPPYYGYWKRIISKICCSLGYCIE